MVKKNKRIEVKLIANPGAGKVADAGRKLKQVMGCLEKHGLKVDVAFARPKEKATAIARRAVKQGYKIVIAMGGDGTVEAVMRGMTGRKARLGIIPTGIENNIARSLGIPLNLEEACALITTTNTLKLDMGQAKIRKGKKFIFFELATIGLSAAVYPAGNKSAGGKLSGIKDAAKTLVHQNSRPNVYVTLDGGCTTRVESLVVMVSNTPVFGKKLLVSPEASMQDGLLDVSVYPEFSKTDLIGYYAAVMDGGYSGERNVQHYQAHKIKVKASPKLDVMADGVSLGKGTVKIKVRPGALHVITALNSPIPEKPQKDAAAELLEPVSPT